MKKRKSIGAVPVIRDDRRVGALVISMAGHDAGTVLAIVAGLDSDYVWIADGKRRRLAAPKKKKMQHLTSIARLSDEQTKALCEGKANDSFLRRAIASLDLEADICSII